MGDVVKLIPNASRTMVAFSELNYDTDSALCDLIDNSISRGICKNVYINFHKNNKKNGELTFTIADDGCGMSSEVLLEAMREGGQTKDYKQGDLSKYGFGLKTASLSQSKEFTVLSREGKSGKINAITKSRALIDKHEDFVVEVHSETETTKIIKRIQNLRDLEINRIFKRSSFTVVYWKELWQINMSYENKDSDAKKETFYNNLISKLNHYIGTVFHRFIEGESDQGAVRIFMNNVEIRPRDPFCRAHKHTDVIDLGKNDRYSLRDGLMPIQIAGFVIPCSPKTGGKCFKSEHDFKATKSPNVSLNDSQGYYIYRNRRLIKWGGWHTLRSKDEHMKLARIIIDLTEEHDDSFGTELKKTGVKFPDSFKIFLKDKINKAVCPVALNKYNGKEAKASVPKSEFRNKNKKTASLAANLIKESNISLDAVYNINRKLSKHQITNDNGYLIKDFDDSITLNSSNLIHDHNFGNDSELWRMEVKDNLFHVVLNKDHPFYDYIYEDLENDQKVRALMEAFAYTLCWTEMKCITEDNRLLFEQIKSVISDTLKKYLDAKILTK